jgi:hypothetical protein
MNLEKAMLPVTRLLSKNKNTINTSLFLILFLFISNTSNFFFKIEAKDEVKNKLKNFFKSPWIMSLITVIIYGVYLTNDVVMLSLLLFIVHIISMHQ